MREVGRLLKDGGARYGIERVGCIALEKPQVFVSVLTSSQVEKTCGLKWEVWGESAACPHWDRNSKKVREGGGGEREVCKNKHGRG